jgi:Xaa-Pro aminopeptidase
MSGTSQLAAARRERLLKAMAEEGAEALVLYGNAWQGDYLRYGTDFAAVEGDALAVVVADGETRLFVESDAEAERAALACPDIKPVATSDIVGEARAYLKRLGNRRLRSAPGTLLPFGLADDKELRLEDGTRMLDRLLMAKLPDEIAAMRRAAELADRGYEVFMAAARIGRPEYALVADVEAFYREQGCPENFQILGSGGVEVRGMHPPGDRRLRAGDLVTTELTPAVEGYYVQICRTLVIGEPAEAQRKAHDVYIEAAAAGEAILKAGVTAAAIAKAENDVFRKYGLGLYCTSEYTRVRGHGLGLFPDSKPHILEDVEVALPSGAAMIVHPNTYHPDVGYMVFGDTVIVTDDGFERLMKTPRELLSVPAR